VFASYTRTSNGKYRWSISFTIPSSNQTVRISRGTPSIVTRTEWLLRAPEGGEKAGKARPAEFALHVPREGVVVRDLLLDFQELVVQASAFFVDVPQGLAEALLAVPPPFRFLAGCLHRAGHRHRPGALGGRTARVGIRSRKSVSRWLYSRIFLRTPSSSLRRVFLLRSSCRSRS